MTGTKIIETKEYRTFDCFGCLRLSTNQNAGICKQAFLLVDNIRYSTKTNAGQSFVLAIFTATERNVVKFQRLLLMAIKS